MPMCAGLQGRCDKAKWVYGSGNRYGYMYEMRFMYKNVSDGGYRSTKIV